MASKMVKLSPPDTFDKFLQLPPQDLMVPGISQYLKLKDIFNFRCCSRLCKELAESAIADRKRVDINSRKKSAMALCRVLSQHCRQLREIYLTELPWITDEMLTAIFTNNPLLEIVVLHGCRYFTPEALHPLGENCKNLKRLKLMHGACDDRFLEMLTQNEVQLEYLVLTRSRGFSKPAVEVFLRTQPLLEEIGLPEMGATLPRTLKAIEETCKKLEFISIPKYRESYDKAIKSLLKASPRLWKILIGKSKNQQISFNLTMFLILHMNTYKHRSYDDYEMFYLHKDWHDEEY